MLTPETGKADVDFRRIDYDVAAAAHSISIGSLTQDFAIQIETGGVDHTPA